MAEVKMNSTDFATLEKVYRAYYALKKDPVKFGLIESELFDDEKIINALFANKKDLGIEGLGNEAIKNAMENAKLFSTEGSRSAALDKLATDPDMHDKFVQKKEETKSFEKAQETKLLPSATDYAEVKLMYDAYNKIVGNPEKFGLKSADSKKDVLNVIYSNYADFGFAYPPTPDDLERIYKNASILSESDNKGNIKSVMTLLSDKAIASEYMRYKGKRDSQINSAQNKSNVALENLAASRKENRKQKRKWLGGLLGKIAVAVGFPALFIGIPFLSAAAAVGGFAALTSVASIGIVTLAAGLGFGLYHAFKGTFSKLWSKLGSRMIEASVRLNPENGAENVLGSNANLRKIRGLERAARREAITENVLGSSRNNIYSGVLDKLEYIASGKNPDELALTDELEVVESSYSGDRDPLTRGVERIRTRTGAHVSAETRESREEEERAFALANQYDEFLTTDEQKKFAEKVAEERVKTIVEDIAGRYDATFTDEQKESLKEQVLEEVIRQKENEGAPSHSVLSVKYNNADGEELETEVSLSREETLTAYNNKTKDQSETNKGKVDEYNSEFEKIQTAGKDISDEQKRQLVEELVENVYFKKDYFFVDHGGEEKEQEYFEEKKDVVEAIYRAVTAKNPKNFLSIIEHDSEFFESFDGFMAEYEKGLDEYNKFVEQERLSQEAKAKKVEEVKNELATNREMFEKTIADNLGEGNVKLATDDVRKKMISDFVDDWAATDGIDEEQKAKLKVNIYHYFTDYGADEVSKDPRYFTEVCCAKVMKDGKETIVSLSADVACAHMGEWLAERKTKAEETYKLQADRKKEFEEFKQHKVELSEDWQAINNDVMVAVASIPTRTPFRKAFGDGYKEAFMQWRRSVVDAKDDTEADTKIAEILKEYYSQKPDEKKILKSILDDSYVPVDKKTEEVVGRYHEGVIQKVLGKMKEKVSSDAAELTK